MRTICTLLGQGISILGIVQRRGCRKRNAITRQKSNRKNPCGIGSVIYGLGWFNTNFQLIAVSRAIKYSNIHDILCYDRKRG